VSRTQFLGCIGSPSSVDEISVQRELDESDDVWCERDKALDKRKKVPHMCMRDFFVIIRISLLNRRGCAVNFAFPFFWNEQDEQHEDDQEHNCPPRQMTESTTIVHSRHLPSINKIYDPSMSISLLSNRGAE